MIEKLTAMAEAARAALVAAQTADEVEAARVRFLGRKGELRELQQGIKDLPADQRPEAGRLINQIKGELEALLQARLEELAAGEGPADAAQVRLHVRARTARRDHQPDRACPSPGRH